MKSILILLLCLSSAVHAQDGDPLPDPNAKSQWTLALEELTKKALQFIVTPLPVLVIQKQLPRTTFAEIVKHDPEAIRILKNVQKQKWNLKDPRNFLSFDYKSLDDVFIDEVGFCSGYTYVTWLLRYLVFFDPAGPLLTPEEMKKLLNQSLYELKPVTISGVGSLLELSEIPEIERYLKLEIGRTWKEQSITTGGLSMYLDQYRGKSVDWKQVNTKVKFYSENGIQPIFYAVTREPWKKLGKPGDVRMVHVMPVVGSKAFDVNPYRHEEHFQKNPQYLKQLEPYQGVQALSMLHTLNKNFQRGFLAVGTDALMVGYDEEKDSVLVNTYIDTVYYLDRISAQVAMNLKQAFGKKIQ